MNKKYSWLISSCPFGKIKTTTNNIYEKLVKLEGYEDLKKDDVLIIAEEKVNQYEIKNIQNDLLVTSYFYLKVFTDEDEVGKSFILPYINDTLKKFKTSVKFMFSNLLTDEELTNIREGKIKEQFSEELKYEQPKDVSQNDTVIIISGSMKNFQGKFLKSKSDGRSIILCKVFGKNNVKLHINNTSFLCERKNK